MRSFWHGQNTALTAANMPIRETEALAQVAAKLVFILRLAQLLLGKMRGLNQRSARAKGQHIKEVHVVFTTDTKVHKCDRGWVEYVFVRFDFPTEKMLQQSALGNRSRPSVDYSIGSYLASVSPNAQLLLISAYLSSANSKFQAYSI